MIEPDKGSTSTEPATESAEPHWTDLFWPALGGGLVGGVVAGLGMTLLGAAQNVHAYWENRLLAIMFAGALGIKVGFAAGVGAGLRLAGAKRGVRGGLWRALMGAYAGLLLSFLISAPGTSLFPALFLFPSPFHAVSFALSLVGGMVGYLGPGRIRRRKLAPRPSSAWRLAALGVAGLVGALVAGWIVSTAVSPSLHGATWHKLHLFVFGYQPYGGSYAGVLAAPLGAAAALSLAGLGLLLRGRFWTCLAGAYAGLFGALALSRLGLPAAQHEIAFLMSCLVISFAGGLTGYLVSLRTRKSCPVWLAAGCLFLALAAIIALPSVTQKMDLPNHPIRSATKRSRRHARPVSEASNRGHTLLSESFDRTWNTDNPPAGWRIFHTGGTPVGNGDWNRDSLHAPWAFHPTPFASIYPLTPMDMTPDSLTSPIIDCRGYMNVTLRCSASFTNVGPNPYTAQIRYSVDSGRTFPYVAKDYYNLQTGTVCESLVLDHATDMPGVQITWFFYGHLWNIGNWYLDDVTVVGELTGSAERDVAPQTTSCRQPANAVPSPMSGAVAFDTVGRRVLLAKPGIYFVREEPQAPSRKPEVVRKVLLVD